MGGSSPGLLTIATVVLVEMVNRPGVPRWSPVLLYGSFIAPGAAAVALSAAGLLPAQRTGARTWLSATAFRLLLGFARSARSARSAIVLMLWRRAEVLSSF
ncbi:hypothetical protein [Nocardia asteroides]|uniref:hypothetical protein n=1 Tax=Nocardia asteroides TaxID=1824 RepID=UPI000363451B|nr:hypothetical protein [Nocardia asteroides]UGT51338.1 hypothetical protein LT345_12695 [Nocardia asteroides]